MENSVDHQVEDVQAPLGDDDVSRMSVITVESTSPPGSVHSINSSVDDVDDYMVDVDADVDKAASDENDGLAAELPVLDVVQSSTGSVTKEESAEANAPESSESLCISEITGKDVTDDVDEADTLPHKAATAPENAEENSVTVNDTPCFCLAGSSDKCDEVASETTSCLLYTSDAADE